MVRTPSCDKNGLKKGTWTPEEDRKLIAYVTRYGCWNWRQLPRFAGLARCGKSCRLRWMNYLRPNIKRGNYTQEEEEIIIRLHKKLGNKWSVIATNLPGRTDNEIKNYWHTTLKKRFQKNAVTHENVRANKSKDSVSKNSGCVQGSDQSTSKISDTGPLSPQLSSSSEFSSKTTDHTPSASNENLAMEDDLEFLDAYTEIGNENIWSETFLSDICSAPIEMVPEPDNDNGNCTLQGSDTAEIPDTWALSPQSLSSESLFQENHQFRFLEPTLPAIEILLIDPCVADVSVFPNELHSPFVHESDHYFCPVYDVDLWNRSNIHEDHISLFK